MRMLADVLNVTAGLIIGLATGFFFERRSATQARRHAAELEEELRILREGIYSVGGQVEPRTAKVETPVRLTHDVRAWINRYQDYQGRVLRSRLVASLVREGHSGLEVEQALRLLTDEGEVAIVDRWVELR